MPCSFGGILPELSFWTLGEFELLACQCIGFLERLWTLETSQETHGHQQISSSVSLLQLIDYVNFSFLMPWRKGKADYLVIMPVDAITNEPQILNWKWPSFLCNSWSKVLLVSCFSCRTLEVGPLHVTVLPSLKPWNLPTRQRKKGPLEKGYPVTFIKLLKD